MNRDLRFLHDRFPRANGYHPDWVIGSASGGANSLWLTEWLTERMDLRPGMRVLDLGCGRGASSIFLHYEFGVEVWATDLWFSAEERQQRIDAVGASSSIHPIHANARSLPFTENFFDAILSIDSFFYFGTDDLYLNYLARFVKPGGQLGICGVAITKEFDGAIPERLSKWWQQSNWIMHSAPWWRRHWERTGIVEIELADTMPDGWKLWVEWLEAVAPENQEEIDLLKADQGENLGYFRVVARRNPGVTLDAPEFVIPAQFTAHPLRR